MNIDFVLPIFNPFIDHGSFVHFRELIHGLIRCGHDVCVQTSNSTGFELNGTAASWRRDMRAGRRKVGAYTLIRHRLARQDAGRARTPPAEPRLYGMPGGEPAVDIRQLTESDVWEVAKATTAQMLEAPPDRERRLQEALGPALPVRRIVAAAKARRAAIITGYFPFQICHATVMEARRTGVPCYVVPMFHPLHPWHYNRYLGEAARHATGILCLAPFAVKYFRELLGQPHAHFCGSSAPTLDLPAPGVLGPRGARDYFVFMGRDEPGKNLAEAVQLVQAVRRQSGRPYTLKAISSLSADSLRGLPSFVIPVAQPTTLEVARILHGAAAFLFPSLFESFGIVVLEALRVGTPALVKSCNIATASLMEFLKLKDLVYANEAEAVATMLRVAQAPLPVPDLSYLSWDAISRRVSDIVATPSR
ncbi:MAG: glycosyltransferase [Lentisphaerae bacterium]|nr:glycosyltransferase [Lentisphaerota bacterium]